MNLVTLNYYFVFILLHLPYNSLLYVVHRYTLCFFFDCSFNGSVLVYVLVVITYIVLSANSTLFLDSILFVLIYIFSFTTTVSSDSLVMHQFVLAL